MYKYVAIQQTVYITNYFSKQTHEKRYIRVLSL